MKGIKKVAIGFMAVVMACGAFAGCAKENEDKNDPNQLNNVPSTETSAPAYDGQIVRAGGAYGLSEKIAFLGSDVMPMSDGTESTSYTPATITLTATVTPADANQAVDWSVEFVNGASTWASGKTVTDYVSVSTESEGSTTANVTCSAPFGEQIKIICTSQDNPNVSASCTVDFVEAIENVSLTFGSDLPINLGGQTDIVWEINKTGVGKGGEANVVIDTSDAYTIASDYNWNIELGKPVGAGSSLSSWGKDRENKNDSAYEDGKFVLNGYDCFIRARENITTLTFDELCFQSSYCGVSYIYKDPFLWTETIVPFSSMNTSELVEMFSNIEDGNLYQLTLNITGAVNKTYTSDLVLTGYTNTSNVKSISLSSNAVQF